MQIMPKTALGTFGVEPQRLWDPTTNIYVGTAYLRKLANRFNGQIPVVLAAYNAGPTRVARGGRLPAETYAYIHCVRHWHGFYRIRYR